MAKDLTKGSIAKSVFDLAWPMAVGVLAVLGFNLVDTYFVGKLGTSELAAMSLTFPVVMIIGAISFGIGVSLSSLVSREIGAKNFDEVKCYTTDCLIFSIVIVSLITIGGLLSMDPLFRLLGATEETLGLVKDYMRIWYFNAFFVIVPMVGNGAIRATGDTKLPAAIMVLAGIINVILDPILIFGWGPIPRMELEGAALATVISRITALIASLYVLHFKLGFLVRPYKNLKGSIRRTTEIIQMAVPTALSNAIVPLSMFVTTAFVARQGESVIAGFGVATRVEILISVLLMGVSAGLGPFIGQNYGAKKFDRVRGALNIAHTFSITWIALVSVLTLFFASTISGVFSENENVISTSTDYLLIVTFSLAFQGILMNVTSAFTAIGKPKKSLLLTILRMLVLYIPLAIFLRSYFAEIGVFYAAQISNIIAGVSAFTLFHFSNRECSSLGRRADCLKNSKRSQEIENNSFKEVVYLLPIAQKVRVVQKVIHRAFDSTFDINLWLPVEGSNLLRIKQDLGRVANPASGSTGKFIIYT